MPKIGTARIQQTSTATELFSPRIPIQWNQFILFIIFIIKLISKDLNWITFRKAIASIIDVTNTPSPTRNEKRANITRIFRTKNIKKFNTYCQIITVKLGFIFFTIAISNVNKFVRYEVITVMGGPWCSHW